MAAAGLVTGALLFGGCGESSSQESAPEARPDPDTPALEVGGKVTDIRYLKVKEGPKDQSFTLAPHDPERQEDLGVIYSPDLSRSLLGTTGDYDPDHAVGVLLAEYSGKVTMSFVFFELHSQEVVRISPAAELDNGRQELFGYHSGPGTGYNVMINPTGDARGDVRIDFQAGDPAADLDARHPEAPVPSV